MAAQAEGKVPFNPKDHGLEFVKAVPRLWLDVETLRRLFSGPTPPHRPYWAKRSAVVFLFGDASGNAFGLGFWR